MAIWRVRLDDDERRIMGVLRSSGARSRKDLAIHLGMSASKLTRLSGNLLAHGLIEECRYADVGTPGRPAVPLRISPTAGYAVGAMVHRGLMEVALVDYAGGVIAHRSQPFDDPDPYVFAARVTAEMHELAIANRLLGRRLLGVGIGVPGAALSSDGTRRWTVDSLAAWRGVDLKALFEEQIGHDVWIENDANAAALAEYYVGGLVRRCTTAVVILLGHGIGGHCRGAHPARCDRECRRDRHAVPDRRTAAVHARPSLDAAGRGLRDPVVAGLRCGHARL
jgi:hypothetical protein